MVAGAVWLVPDPPVHANTRYIHPTLGVDQGTAGKNEDSPFKTEEYAAANSPADCSIIYPDGTFSGRSNPINTQDWGFNFQPNTTLRAKNWGKTTLSGTGEFARFDGGTGGTAGVQNMGFWGLSPQGWGDQYGDGLFTFIGNINGFNLTGLQVFNPGDGTPFGQDHGQYFGHGGGTFGTAVRNFLVQYCSFAGNLNGLGAIMAQLYGSGYGAHDLTFDHILASGSGMRWLMIVTAAYAAGLPANIMMNMLDARLQFTDAMFRGYKDYNSDNGIGSAPPYDGADPTWVLQNSVLVANAGSSGNFWSLDSTPGLPHRPTSRNNRYSGASVGIPLGAGDVIGAPLTDQPTLAYSPASTTVPTVTPTTVLLHPMSAARKVQQAVAGAAVGGKRLAALNVLASLAGTQGIRLRGTQGGVDKFSATATGTPTVTAAGLAYPQTTISPVVALDSDTASTLTLEAVNRSWRLPVGMGRSGAAATLADDLTSTSSVTVAANAVILSLDPNLDASALPSGATVLATGSVAVPAAALGGHIHDPLHFTMGRTMPITSTRYHDLDALFWRNWHNASGVHFEGVDPVLDYHQALGHEHHLCFFMTPDHLKTTNTNALYPSYPGGLNKPSSIQAAVDALDQFLAHCQNRGTPIATVEPWNEPSWSGGGSPNGDSFWQNSPADLAALHKALYPVIKKYGARCLNAGFSYIDNSITQFLNALGTNPGQWFDWFAYHPYDAYARASENTNGNAKTVDSFIAQVRQYSTAGGLSSTFPLVDTEHGYGAYDGNHYYGNASGPAQANLLLGAWLMTMIRGVMRLDWYDLDGTYIGALAHPSDIATAFQKMVPLCGKTLTTVYIDQSGNYGYVAS